MNKKSIFALLALMLSLSMVPVNSWVYQDGTPEDSKYERFGPRADKLSVNLYDDENAEWSALMAGEIDMTDWPLTKTMYEILTTSPYDETINVVGYGPDYSFSMLDINNDNTTSSPIFPNPCSVVSFRQAIAHLIDRAMLDSIIGPGFYVPIWVPMSPVLGKYLLNITNPYPPNATIARMLLDADGFPLNLATGWRFWDRNGNGIEEPDERLELKFVIRSDQEHYLEFWTAVILQLIEIGIRVNVIYATAGEAYIIVMIERDFHLYSGTYYCPDPTYLYSAFHSSMIPLPGSNYNSINDTELDYWLGMLLSAATQQEAVIASINAERVFVEKCFKVPVWAYVNCKAMYRRYTGGTAGLGVIPDDGENQYRNKYWQGVVNIQGHGIDNDFSFLNMHPTGFAYGHNENMTIRWGFKISQIRSLNPLYAEALWDWKVIGLIYDPLISQDPYNTTEYEPWIAKTFAVDTYLHPVYGECTKINVTMRTDITWQDGTPLTAADVEFTFVDLDDMLEDLGYPPPYWQNNVDNILDLKILDAYNFEILFDVKSYWMLSNIGGLPILPKHIWRPIVEAGDPTGFAPDPNLIGNGPWRLKEYVQEAEPGHVLMLANKPNSTVQTNMPGSEPTTSTNGYFQYYPVYEDIHFKPPYEYRHKIPPEDRSVEFKVTLENLVEEHMIVENITDVSLASPIGSEWNETWPIPSVLYACVDWIDNGDTILSPCDIIGLAPIFELTEWYHVEDMLWETDPISPEWSGVFVLELRPVVLVNKFLYIDGLVEEPIPVYLIPEIPHEQQRLIQVTVGLHTIKLEAHIKEPNWDSWKLYCKWVNYTFIFWVTIREDIVGSTLYDDIGFPDYPYKIQLPSPDFRVDMRDIGYVASAFGSYPGHERWRPLADISCDYRIDMRDVGAIARKFGWHG